MDRNGAMRMAACGWIVALRKESVDRNTYGRCVRRIVSVSLSARRAWIEIPHVLPMIVTSRVALRKESVDRNSSWVISSSRPRRSLSARRAWIEMSRAPVPHLPMAVALRKESVDRN